MDAEPVPSPDGSEPLTVASRLGEPSVITVAGDADLDGVVPLRQAVEAALAHHPHLVLDLTGVGFADSTFLTSLLLARNSALEQEGSVRLLGVSTQVGRLLDLTGAAELFPVITEEQLRQS
ncbi:STAS domain-containing protein [Actinacidiphila polyblastidii]|uniref:STAS domain-containing protein n=1 Tax=Actinacidiphila polyblastidii TaxID=3110430 RepID=UPI0039BC54AA